MPDHITLEQARRKIEVLRDKAHAAYLASPSGGLRKVAALERRMLGKVLAILAHIAPPAPLKGTSVLVSLADPELVVHDAHAECATTEPHRIPDCGLFSKDAPPAPDALREARRDAIRDLLVSHRLLHDGASLVCRCGWQVPQPEPFPGGLHPHDLHVADAIFAHVAPPAELRDATLRRLLWLRHGCPIPRLYGDDGEMQCGACGIDFKRDSPEGIEDAWRTAGERAVRAALAAAPEGETP